jgi:tetratricopeptide (TPR) repeat protein
MRSALMVLTTMVLAAAGSLIAQGPPALPLTAKELVEILKSKEHRPHAAAIVEHRGVEFELNADIEKQLRKAKADDQLIEIVRKAGPSGRSERAQAQGNTVVTPEEAREFQAIQNELDPDRQIQLAAEFEQKHPNSSLLTYAHVFAASAYNQKGDVEQAIKFCEKSLKLKPDNLMALLIISPILPQPQALRGANVDQRLDQAEQAAKQALQLVDQLTVQPSEQPVQFEARKASYQRDLHSALGMVHMQRSLQGLEGPDRKELEVAEQEYQTAIGLTQEPFAADYFRLGEIRERLGKTDPAIEAYSKSAELGQGTVIKTYADQRIAALQKAKGQSQVKTQ